MSDRPSDTGFRRGSKATPAERARLALLTAESAKDKLAAVAEGDPLGLFALSLRRVQERWFLLDPDRVFEESVFNVVGLSHLLTRERDIEPWLVERVDEAIGNLLRRDHEGLAGGEVAESIEESAAYLAQIVELDAPRAFEAAAKFNRLAERTRRTYFALMVEGKSIAECLEMGLGTLDELRDHAVRAVDLLVGRSAT